MGVEYGAVQYSIIHEKHLGDIVGEDILTTLYVTMALYGVELDNLARSEEYSEDLYSDDEYTPVDEEATECIQKLYQAVIDEFKEVTGLHLGLVFVGGEDMGTLASGGHWDVGGVWQRTPAAEDIACCLHEGTSIWYG